MKNISTHVAIAVVSLVLVIASAFLMTAPEAGMRLIGEYVTESAERTRRKACSFFVPRAGITG